ncbi:MAG: EAL domain-containing protein, partial [Betaproteobacteria bacterium]
ALAEETGLTVPMGWFALNNACRQLATWRQQLSGAGGDSLSMSINLTAAHFGLRDVIDQVGAILSGTGVSAGMNFEVTERSLIADPAKAAAVLNRLRALGVGIHLDDFGTGYSSLQYLHELPFDAIKIDRSFIARMSKGGRDAQIAATIRELARRLGVPVIAEGVETEEQLALVRELGCEFAQGYFFSRPIPGSQMAALLAKSPTW